VVKPAANWNQVREHAEKLTKRLKDSDTITQPAVALGTGNNVHRSGDIVMALMAQNGARIAKDDGAFIFHTPGNTTPAKDEALPGARALQFYLDFANPASKAYSWNPDQGDALDAFIQGRLAYYFGYSYDISTIRSRNPRLNFDIASLPQFEKPVNIANYWMESVSSKAKNKNEAWLFVLETATNKDALTKFLKRTRRASALTELIQTQLDDVDLAVFAQQNLTAQTWYHGKDSKAGDQILVEMIESARAKLVNPTEELDITELTQQAVQRAAVRLNDTL
jgi:maltose-binding protein MalE